MKKNKSLLSLALLPLLAGCSTQLNSADYRRRAEACEAEKTAIQAARDAEFERLKKNRQIIEASLRAEIDSGHARVTELKGRLSVSLVEKILFNSGETELLPQARGVLDKVGAFLNTIPDKDIRIEGHTDSVPIGAKLQYKFPSNWGLSAARATEIARYLQDVAKVEPTRLSAVGYGKFRPIADNNTAEGRVINRRIEIQLISPEE
jgi:chemotaxis protein MotB